MQVAGFKIEQKKRRETPRDHVSFTNVNARLGQICMKISSCIYISNYIFFTK